MNDNTDILDNLIDMGVAPVQEVKTIKVIGVGNGGCNAVDNLASENIDNVSCLVCDSNTETANPKDAIDDRVRRFFPNLAYPLPQPMPEDIEEEESDEEDTAPTEETGRERKGKSLWEKFSDFVTDMLKPEA